jgi:hypothetical protein
MNMAALQAKYLKLLPHLNERLRRLVAAADALALGRGGVAQGSERHFEGLDLVFQLREFF